MRGSIRTRLTLAFIGLAIGPLLLVGGILARQSFITQEQQALNLQREVARRVSSQVQAFLDELENELDLVSQVQGLQKLSPDKQRSILAQLLTYQDAFESLVLLDNHGQEQAHVARSSLSLIEPGAHTQADEFLIPRTSGRTYYSPVYFNETTGEPFITIAVPLYDVRTGLVNGVLVADVRLERIWDLIMNLRTNPGQSVYIVDAENKVIAHHNPSVVLRGTTFPVPAHDGIQPGLASVSPMVAVDVHEGLSIQSLAERLTSPDVVLAVDTVHIGEQEFNIIAEQTVAEALALAITTILVTASLTLAALVISVVLGLVIVRQVVQPIQAMAMTAQAISAGDLSRQVQVASRDEVGVLAAAFNSMTSQLSQSLESLKQQVVEVKQAEESLRRANETLQALIDYSPLAITMLDLDSHVLLWNNAAEKMYGWTAQEILGELIPFVPEDKLEEIQAINERVNKGEIITHLELERRRKDASTILTGVSIAPLRDSTGSVYARMCIAADITERKKAEEALQESEERLRQIASSLREVIWLRDAQTRQVLYVNPAFEELTGWTCESFYENPNLVMDAIHPDDKDTVVKALNQRFEGVRYNEEHRIIHRDGRVRWVASRSFPVRNEAGEIFRLASIMEDITERKRTEEALRESEQRFRTIFDSANDAIFVHDLGTGSILDVNASMCAMYGYTREEALQININDVSSNEPPYTQREALVWIQKAVKEGPQLFEWRAKDKVGRLFWVEVNMRLAFIDGQERVLVVARDITSRKQAEAEREALIKNLETQNAELERFTYTVSHDLKSPLITIRGFLGYIEQDIQSGEMNRLKEDMQRITAATDKMQRLLTELLELSRIGRLMNPPENIPLGDLIQEAIKLLDGRLQERNIEIKIQDDLPVLFGDPQRLLEVVQNLLDNAVKFMGEQPKPVIEIGTQGEESGLPIIYIRDNGIGIAPEYHGRIFGLFNKLNPSMEGTGVGLTIVKRIVEVYGGRIWVESEEGKGATFYFTFGKGTQGL